VKAFPIDPDDGMEVVLERVDGESQAAWLISARLSLVEENAETALDAGTRDVRRSSGSLELRMSRVGPRKPCNPNAELSDD
jgi:hypothetical protein